MDWSKTEFVILPPLLVFNVTNRVFLNIIIKIRYCLHFMAALSRAQSKSDPAYTVLHLIHTFLLLSYNVENFELDTTRNLVAILRNIAVFFIPVYVLMCFGLKASLLV